MKKLPVLLLVMLTTMFLIPGCEVENCPPNAMTYAHFSLADQNGKAFNTSDTISVIGQTVADVTVYDTLDDGTLQARIVQDSLISDTIINRESGAGSFSIPLSYANHTRILFSYSSVGQTFRGIDTIEISHRNIPYFTNLDCGSMMFYEITNVTATRHRMDSLVIINPNIDNNEKENFKIYYTVADTDE